MGCNVQVTDQGILDPTSNGDAFACLLCHIPAEKEGHTSSLPEKSSGEPDENNNAEF
jgi:hypothetical protein